MKVFRHHKGAVAVLDRINVDTDQIIPKQFLKRIERTGYGEFLFFDWRFQQDGKPNPDFELNQPRFQLATILLAGANFGCGSSREHAAWALQDYGFRAILAPSFSDIFYNNCFQNGLLPIRVPNARMQELFDRAKTLNAYHLSIDLEKQQITDDFGVAFSFDIDPFRKNCLLQGLDDIGLTLLHETEISEYERHHTP
jgi:3-isopropylmalate/(R)-2-methylmalate dehydratase small subunit